jgi:PII-like signaling protein
MQLPKQAVLLRIFIGEDDRTHGRPLYEAIVTTAREMHIAGATVLRGPMGFGRSSRLHTAKILRLSEDLPMVVEIVDAEDRIQALLAAIEPMMGSGLVTLEKVQVVRYGEGEPEPGNAV